MQEAAKEQMNKMTSSLVTSSSEMNSAMHDTVNATMQSASIMMKGCGDLYDTLSSLMQKSIEQNALVSQAMMSANSVDELVTKQGDMMKTSFDDMISDVNNITQLSSRIAKEAAEPVTNHVNQTMNKMSQTANDAKAA